MPGSGASPSSSTPRTMARRPLAPCLFHCHAQSGQGATCLLPLIWAMTRPNDTTQCVFRSCPTARPRRPTSMTAARSSAAHRAATRVNAAPAAFGAPGRRPRATTEPVGERVASSVHPSVNEQARSRSATASSLAHRDPPAPHAALLMAQELLRYRPTDGGYDAWLGRITELFDATRDGQTPSRSLPAPPSHAERAGRDTPPPPPLGRDAAEQRHATRAPEPSHGSSMPAGVDGSC